MYKITVMGEEKQYPEGTTYGQIVEEYQGRFEDMIALWLRTERFGSFLRL